MCASANNLLVKIFVLKKKKNFIINNSLLGKKKKKYNHLRFGEDYDVVIYAAILEASRHLHHCSAALFDDSAAFFLSLSLSAI